MYLANADLRCLTDQDNKLINHIVQQVLRDNQINEETEQQGPVLKQGSVAIVLPQSLNEYSRDQRATILNQISQHWELAAQ